MSGAELGPRRQALLRGLGLLFAAIGAAGIFLPLLPGTVFLILAAACFARSSPKLEAWLLDHPLLGPGVRKWRERGAISRKSKLIALSMMAASAIIVMRTGAPDWAKMMTLILIAAGAIFVATRPKE